MERYVTVDAHLHLWKQLNGRINGRPVVSIGDGKCDFGGEVRQMMPPYIVDGCNTAEKLMANMNYAGVNAAVVTQEYIDGNQDEYLLEAKSLYPERLKICALYEERPDFRLDGFDGLKICAGRLKNLDLTAMLDVFEKVQEAGKFISIDMAVGDLQTESMKEVIKCCPDLKIAIGHFGMVTTPNWQKQIELAQNKNVYIESGGLTWLFHKEFYPYPSAIDAVLEARDICGMEKLMWGSDYPRTMTDITYIMAVRFIADSDKLSVEEKRMFLGENALDFYGFGPQKVLPEITNML